MIIFTEYIILWKMIDLRNNKGQRLDPFWKRGKRMRLESLWTWAVLHKRLGRWFIKLHLKIPENDNPGVWRTCWERAYLYSVGRMFSVLLKQLKNFVIKKTSAGNICLNGQMSWRTGPPLCPSSGNQWHGLTLELLGALAWLRDQTRFILDQ